MNDEEFKQLCILAEKTGPGQYLHLTGETARALLNVVSVLTRIENARNYVTLSEVQDWARMALEVLRSQND